MPKIKIIPNYYKNIEKAKKLTLPRKLIYLRQSYISPIEDIKIIKPSINKKKYHKLYRYPISIYGYLHMRKKGFINSVLRPVPYLHAALGISWVP